VRLADILRNGCARAHQRPGLIFLDVLWKIIWIVLTLAALLLAMLWITSYLQGIEWEDTGVPALNGVIAASLFGEFWNANRGAMLITIFAFLCVSALVWVFLEAYFRRIIVRDVSNENTLADSGPRSNAGNEHGPKAAATYPFKMFLASGAIKNGVLLTGAFGVMAVSFAGAAVIAIVTFLVFAFFLTLLDTTIRADAVDLLGTDLIRVAGLLGILMSFEGMVASLFLAILFAGFLNIAGPAGAAAMLAATAAVIVVLNVLHSYLLLVRFSAIAIMRRNVVEV
jgi:hypothetical protein